MTRALLAAVVAISVLPPLVTISGQVTIGGTLTAVETGGPVTSRKWQRGNIYGQAGIGSYTDIGGATATTYTPVIADIGFAIRCVSTGGGGTANSNALHYTYASIAAVIEAVEFTDLAAGAVAALTGSKAGFAFIQATGGKQPTKSGSSLLTWSGGQRLTASLVTAFNGLTAVRVVMRVQDANDASQMLCELGTTWTTTDGTFAIGTKLDGATTGTLNGGARGVTNFGYARAPGTLASQTVISVCCDTSVADGVAFVRTDGVSQTVTAIASTCGAGPLRTLVTLNLGARQNDTVPFTGTMQGGIIFLSGNAQDSDLADAEAYVGNAP